MADPPNPDEATYLIMATEQMLRVHWLLTVHDGDRSRSMPVHQCADDNVILDQPPKGLTKQAETSTLGPRRAMHSDISQHQTHRPAAVRPRFSTPKAWLQSVAKLKRPPRRLILVSGGTACRPSGAMSRTRIQRLLPARPARLLHLPGQPLCLPGFFVRRREVGFA